MVLEFFIVILQKRLSNGIISTRERRTDSSCSVLLFEVKVPLVLARLSDKIDGCNCVCLLKSNVLTTSDTASSTKLDTLNRAGVFLPRPGVFTRSRMLIAGLALFQAKKQESAHIDKQKEEHSKRFGDPQHGLWQCVFRISNKRASTRKSKQKRNTYVYPRFLR